MSSRLFVPDSPTPITTSAPVADLRGWSVLQPAALLFVMVGFMDVALAWMPLALGRPEWEFTTVTATFNGLPGPTIGLALLAASGIALRQPKLVRTVSIVFAVLALLIVLAALLYALDIPVAFKAVPSTSPARAGLDKAIAKTLLQALLYTVMLVWMAVVSWRRVRSHRD